MKPETKALDKQYNDLLKQGRIDGDRMNPVMKNCYNPDMKRCRLQIEANDPGRWFRTPDHTGSCRKDAGKSPDPAGKHRKSLEYGSSIPIGNCQDFSRWIPVNFLCFPAGTDWKSSEKIRKFSGRNTASTKSPELPGTASFRTGLFDLGRLIQLNFSGSNCMHYKCYVNRTLILSNFNNSCLYYRIWSTTP